jgi:hypothetical protein
MMRKQQHPRTFLQPPAGEPGTGTPVSPPNILEIHRVGTNSAARVVCRDQQSGTSNFLTALLRALAAPAA